MSKPVDPRHVPVTKEAIARWLTNWMELTRRRWWVMLGFSIAVDVVFGVAAMHVRSAGEGFLLAMQTLDATAFGAGIVLYLGSDKSVGFRQSLASFNAGAKPWFVIAFTWLLVNVLIGFILGFVVTLVRNAITSILGALGASGHHAAAHAVAPAHNLLTIAAQFLCLSGGAFAMSAGAFSIVTITAYVVFALTQDISESLHLTLMFYARNVAILFILLAAPFLLAFGSILGVINPYLGVVMLPVVALLPALLSGVVYVIARESFLGDKENAKAREKSRVTSRQWVTKKA